MIAALLASAALQVAPAPQPPVAFGLRAVPFPGLDAPRTVGCLTLRAGLTLEADRDGFGGYSDLTLEGPDGRATFASDAAHLMWARLTVNAEGDVVDVTDARLAALMEQDGSTLTKRDGDAEGLAWLGAGYAVAFEGEDRIARVSEGGAVGTTLYPDAADAAVFGANSGFEALAVLRDGTLLAMSEGVDADGDAVVRRGTLDAPLGAWTRAAYRPARSFAVTAADTDPATGDLFVLERAYSPWRGPRMRIVRVALDDLDEERLRGRELGRMGFLEGIDNMEGLAATRTKDGRLRLILVSDDNYSAAQRTVVLTLGLAPGCEDGDPAEPAARGDAPPQHAVGR